MPCRVKMRAMRIHFTKMQGLGNDFVVLDAMTQPFVPDDRQARWLADRHFGIGCDQILVVEKSTRADFRYRIFNADGSEVEQCGNGARCFARFVTARGLTPQREIRVETKGGLITLRLEPDDRVTVDMGIPETAEALVEPLAIETGIIEITAVSMGNPHAVQMVENVDSAWVGRDGPLIERHPRFPLRVNAGFMQIVDRQTIRLRVFERGAGETLACGTGACAAVVAGICRGLLETPVRVLMAGGELTIGWTGQGTSVQMTGPAVFVFEGTIEIPEEIT